MKLAFWRNWGRREAPRQIVVRSGFAGAAVNRLTASMQQWAGAVNADLDGQLVILRARARSLCANNEFGRRFLSLVAANVVGPDGPTLQVRAKNVQNNLDKPANDAIEIHWARWAETADITGRMTLARLLAVVVKSVARDGEALVRIVRDRSLPYGIALQALEADRLDESYNATAVNGNRVRMGVELASTGRPVAYYVLTEHPGENWARGPRKVERVAAADLLHVFLPERAEQVRGYTWMHAAIIRAQMLAGYEEAAIVAARVGASKVGVWVQEEGAAPGALAAVADGQSTNGALQMSAEPGEFLEAPAGYKLDSWDPQYPHENFESFLKQCLRGLAAGLDVATHNLSGDMTDVNYSSARIAELNERDLWRGLQGWLFASVAKPVYREWLAAALIRGDITFEATGKTLPAERLSKFADAARFVGRTWEWVDPLKEAEASVALINAGLASRTEIAAGRGREFDDVVDELGQEKDAMDAAGINPEPPAPAKPDPAAAKAEEIAAALALVREELARLDGQMGALRDKPAVTNVTIAEGAIQSSTPVTIAEGAVRTEVSMPEREVHLEATIEAPPPAQNTIVLAQPKRTVETIERDELHEMRQVTRVNEY